MNDELAAWLRQEVEGLLDVSDVGLYELIWLLRGRHPEMPDGEAKALANVCLQQLLSDRVGCLVRLVWPSHEPIDDADPGPLPVDAFDDPQEGIPYFALVRCEEGDAPGWP
jgi:hypothetical protein